MLSYQAGNTSHPQALTLTNTEDRYGLVEEAMKADMLKPAVQVATGTTLDSSKTDIRLVSSVDSLGYQKVGFRLQFKNANGQLSTVKDYWTSTVYSTIQGKDNTVITTYKANEEFVMTSKYFITVTIEGLPQAQFDGTIYVTPIVMDKDGTVVEGTQGALVISELITASSLAQTVSVQGAPVGNVTANTLCEVTVDVERKNLSTVL